MKKLSCHFVFSEYNSIRELNKADRQLLLAARQAMKNAYAPYSGFFVGAAVLLKNGKIICGNNQENLAFPSGLCAERVAIFSAGAQYPKIPVKAVAITAGSNYFKVNKPVSPCGACRQVLLEYESRNKSAIRIILQGTSGKIRVINSCAELLPLAYVSEKLKRKG